MKHLESKFYISSIADQLVHQLNIERRAKESFLGETPLWAVISGLPRQCGKTRWIMEKAKGDAGALVVTCNWNLAKVYTDSAVRAIPVSRFETYIDSSVKVVYLDEFSFFDRGVEHIRNSSILLGFDVIGLSSGWNA